MGIFGSLAKAGVAKKVYDEARKPKNQRKLKQLWARTTGQSAGKSSGKSGGKSTSRSTDRSTSRSTGKRSKRRR